MYALCWMVARGFAGGQSGWLSLAVTVLPFATLSAVVNYSQLLFELRPFPITPLSTELIGTHIHLEKSHQMGTGGVCQKKIKINALHYLGTLTPLFLCNRAFTCSTLGERTLTLFSLLDFFKSFLSSPSGSNAKYASLCRNFPPMER